MRLSNLRFPVLALAMIAGIGYAAAQTTNPVPVATGAQVGVASGQVIGSNPTRRSISICNPSATVTVWIAPGSQAAVANGGGSISIAPVASNVTSCYTPPTGSGGGSTNIGASWNAIAQTATPTSLTIWEYF